MSAIEGTTAKTSPCDGKCCPPCQLKDYRDFTEAKCGWVRGSSLHHVLFVVCFTENFLARNVHRCSKNIKSICNTYKKCKDCCNVYELSSRPQQGGNYHERVQICGWGEYPTCDQYVHTASH